MEDYDEFINEKLDEILIEIDDEKKRLKYKRILKPIATFLFWFGFYLGYSIYNAKKFPYLISYFTTTDFARYEGTI
jgi:hypothetical protein